MFKINPSTPIKTIINRIEDDMEIIVTEATAQQMKDAHRKGCLMWTSDSIITTDDSRIRIVKAEDGHIESTEDYSPLTR